MPLPASKSAHRRAAFAALACCLVIGGCGGGAAGNRESAGGQASAAQSAKAYGGVLGVRSARAARGSSSAHAAEADSTRLFAPTSFWNRPLAAGAPLDRDSAAMVAGLAREVASEQAARRGPWINTTSYGVPIFTVPGDQPTVSVALDHPPDAALSSAWSAVPLPADARASAGSDGYMVVWQPSSDRMWEFWRLHDAPDGWHASWGGAIMHVSANTGVYGPDAWPGAKNWWGATASSLALAGGAMTIAELRHGVIGHALAIALPDVRAGVFALPAKRTDGTSGDPLSLPEGARLRLDPRLDLSTLSMPPLVRAMAVAAQRYGIIVRDVAGVVAFIAQDPTGTGSQPYTNGFFEGKYPNQLLASFPWSHLQVLRLRLHKRP